MAMDEEKIAQAVCTVLKAELNGCGLFKSHSLTISPKGGKNQILILQRIKMSHYRLPVRLDVVYEEERPSVCLSLIDERAVKAAKAWCKAGNVKYDKLVDYSHDDEEIPYLYLSHNESICSSLIEIQQSLMMFLTHLLTVLNEVRAEQKKAAEKEAKEAKKQR